MFLTCLKHPNDTIQNVCIVHLLHIIALQILFLTLKKKLFCANKPANKTWLTQNTAHSHNPTEE